MKENFEEIIEKYQEEVNKYNKSEGKREITNYNIAIKAMFKALNMLSIQNDTIIKLLVNERLEKENGRDNEN